MRQFSSYFLGTPQPTQQHIRHWSNAHKRETAAPLNTYLAPLIAYLKRQEMALQILQILQSQVDLPVLHSRVRRRFCVGEQNTHQENVYFVLGVFNTGPQP